MQFCKLNVDQTKQMFGLEAYRQDVGPRADVDADLDDWLLVLPFEGEDGDVEILCCPEDRVCETCQAASRYVCGDCQVPICRTCSAAVYSRNPWRKPVAALSNDLMIFYAPDNLYRQLDDNGNDLLQCVRHGYDLFFIRV